MLVIVGDTKRKPQEFYKNNFSSVDNAYKALCKDVPFTPAEKNRLGDALKIASNRKGATVDIGLAISSKWVKIQ